MTAVVAAVVIGTATGIVAARGAPADAATATATSADRPSPTTTAAPPPPPKAWILVDVDTGEVIDAGNDHAPLPPASLTKVITALAASNLAPATPVLVSARAAAAPADKISLKQGQVWTADELFHALLISSANDAAVALAEQVGGTLEGFQTIFQRTALGLGMADSPVLMDPAGLDGPVGVDGGNLVSARDLAIAGRALLATPYLAAIVATPIYYFDGPDGVHHRLTNHNHAFLTTYPGAIGVKTGYTVRAGACLMAAARVNGRTMLAVVLNSENPALAAKLLLDKGFATPGSSESTADQLPGVNLNALRPPVATPQVAARSVGPSRQGPTALAPTAASATDLRPSSPSFLGLASVVGLVLLLCVALVFGSARRRRRSTATVWLDRDR